MASTMPPQGASAAFSESSPPPEVTFLASHLRTLLPSALANLLGPAPADHLLSILVSRYSSHWYPDAPERGSGYRAISHDPLRRDGFVDPVLAEAATCCRWTVKELRRALRPSRTSSDPASDGWTLWCDPGCVSIRYAAPSTGGEIKELWGSLPAHLSHLTQSALNFLPQHRAASMAMPQPRSASASLSVASPLRHRPSKPSLLATEGSPVKAGSAQAASRAIPILAPSTAVRNRGVGAIGVTPPTPIPGHENLGALEINDEPSAAENDAETVEESNDEEEPLPLPTTLSFGQPSRSPTPTSPSPVSPTTPGSLPLGDDPFLRPCSRSSSGSVGSIGSGGSGSTSADSIFSLASVASSVASAVTASPGGKSVGGQQGQASVAKKSSGQPWARHHSTGSLPFVPSSSAMAPQRSLSPLGFSDLPSSSRSVPASPRKPSTTAAAAAASAFPPLTSTAMGRERQMSAPTRPKSGQAGSHSRSHSGQHGLTVRDGPGTVTNYSNGQVGVLGGGILLGRPKPAPAAAEGESASLAPALPIGAPSSGDECAAGATKGRKRGGRRGRGQGSQQGSGTWTPFHGAWTGGSVSSVGSFTA